jgi:hypothetical protein
MSNRAKIHVSTIPANNAQRASKTNANTRLLARVGSDSSSRRCAGETHGALGANVYKGLCGWVLNITRVKFFANGHLFPSIFWRHHPISNSLCVVASALAPILDHNRTAGARPPPSRLPWDTVALQSAVHMCRNETVNSHTRSQDPLLVCQNFCHVIAERCSRPQTPSWRRMCEFGLLGGRAARFCGPRRVLLIACCCVHRLPCAAGGGGMLSVRERAANHPAARRRRPPAATPISRSCWPRPPTSARARWTST